MFRQLSGGRGRLTGVVLVAVVLALLSFSTAGRVTAQQAPDDGCDPSELVACLAVPEEAPSGTAASGAAPTTASPLPRPGPYPYPYPYPCPPVIAQGGAPGAAIAVPIPVPSGCSTRPVLATVNRANVLYTRALRTLDTRDLPPVWSGVALDELRGYVETLRSSGRYATPELRWITLTSLRVEADRARVTTVEGWLYQERSRLTGAVVVEQDQRVYNLYELRLRAGIWTVIRNEVSPTVYSPSPPPLPSPPVCILIYPPPPGCETLTAAEG